MGIFGNTDSLVVQHSQYNAFMLAQVRHQIQHTGHFLAAHPAGSTVGALGRVNEIPVSIIFAGIAVAHAHDHEQQNCQQADADQDTVHSIGRMKHGGQTGKKIRRRHRRRSSVSGDAAALFPRRVIAKQLCQETACV